MGPTTTRAPPAPGVPEHEPIGPPAARAPACRCLTVACAPVTQDPHDALCKAAFSRMESAAGAITASLPPAVLAQLDLGSLRLSSTSCSVVDLLAALPRSDRERAWVCILEVTAEPEADLVIEALREALLQEQQEDVMTAGEALRLEGERRGRLKVKRETLLAQLRVKFRQISAEMERRVAEADERALDRWAEAVLFAATIDEVWAGD